MYIVPCIPFARGACAHHPHNIMCVVIRLISFIRFIRASYLLTLIAFFLFIISSIIKDKIAIKYVNMTQSIVSTLDMKDFFDYETPSNEKLSGLYIRSFAYKTINERLPVIVTGIIDSLSRNKESIVEKYGPNSSDELKQVIGGLSQLRSEIMTNKPLKLLDLTNSEKDRDAAIWNESIENETKSADILSTWYGTRWLFCECYAYRRISQIFAITRTLSTYDPFEDKKKKSFATFHHIVDLLAKHVLNITNKTDNYSTSKCQEDFIYLLKLSLWGNRCDLSMSSGAVKNNEAANPNEQLKSFDNDILVDDSVSIWNILRQSKEIKDENVIVDIVLDNSGYELFTDICLAVFLTEYNLAQKIRFYVKSIPWFISDTMKKDFLWLIDDMKNSSDIHVRTLSEKCWNYIDTNRWTIEIESFWTEPFDYSEMKIQSPKLYEKLAESKLIIIKGDLNYRKLLGDINWKYDTNFTTALRGFQPTNIVSLRTVKSDLIAGLSNGKAAELFIKQENWMTTGQYGLIQAALK